MCLQILTIFRITQISFNTLTINIKPFQFKVQFINKQINTIIQRRKKPTLRKSTFIWSSVNLKSPEKNNKKLYSEIIRTLTSTVVAIVVITAKLSSIGLGVLVVSFDSAWSVAEITSWCYNNNRHIKPNNTITHTHKNAQIRYEIKVFF